MEYASPLSALDALDGLAARCRARLAAVGGARSDAEVLEGRFVSALEGHRKTRDEVRRRFGLPATAKPAAPVEAEGDLKGLRQALDDLMVAYAETLPVFGDAKVVSRLAVDMVEVSKLRTVIDLWVTAEES